MNGLPCFTSYGLLLFLTSKSLTGKSLGVRSKGRCFCIIKFRSSIRLRTSLLSPWLIYLKPMTGATRMQSLGATRRYGQLHLFLQSAAAIGSPKHTNVRWRVAKRCTLEQSICKPFTILFWWQSILMIEE